MQMYMNVKYKDMHISIHNKIKSVIQKNKSSLHNIRQCCKKIKSLQVEMVNKKLV